MEYQVVLQLRGNDCLSFDTMINLEGDIQRVIEPVADVDGHDVGSGEMNLFILTVDPAATFERAKPVLAAASLLDKVSVAYRELRSDEFTIIWHTSSTGAFVVS